MILGNFHIWPTQCVMIIYHVELPCSFSFDYLTALASVSDLRQRNVSQNNKVCSTVKLTENSGTLKADTCTYRFASLYIIIIIIFN